MRYYLETYVELVERRRNYLPLADDASPKSSAIEASPLAGNEPGRNSTRDAMVLQHLVPNEGANEDLAS